MYVSGTPSGSERYLEEEAARSTYRLCSLHGNYLPAVMKWTEKAKGYKKLPKAILLDSGAFTAWNKGHKTSVDEVIYAYDHFITATDGMFEEVWGINLDVIPGSVGVDPTPQQIEEAVAESDINFKILTDRFGDRILPVFHQGEDMERLDVVASQAKYICVSPRNDLAETHRVKWAREVHLHTEDNQTHGLATTGAHMLTVPWYSVDSATAIHVAAYGMLIFFVDNDLRKIFVTLDDEKHKYVDKHVDTLSPYMTDKCMDLIENDSFPLQELRTNVKSRILFNISQLTNYMESLNQFHVEQLTLF
jgi:hypothetical protein